MFAHERAAADRRRRVEAARAQGQEQKEAIERATPHPLARYIKDPVGFADDFLPALPLAPYQKDALHNLVAPDGQGRSAVKGPRGLGKTTVAAIAIVWFAVIHDACRADWKCVITSGSWYQITAYLFPEIRKVARLLDWEALGVTPWKEERELLKTGISLTYGQATSASPDRAELIEGAHASAVKHPDGTVTVGAVMVVFDESKAVPDSTFDAIEGVFSGVDFDSTYGYALAVSTPGTPAGRFFDIHTRKQGTQNWTVRSVSLLEAVRAKRVTIGWAKNLRDLWGSDSPYYHQHVQGKFSADQENAVIPSSWIEAAVDRWRDREALGWNAPPESDYGIDVAREGKDKTVICIGRGRDHVQEFRRLDRHDDFTLTARDIAAITAEIGTRPSRIAIDADGMGVGLGDILRSMGFNVYFFRGAPRPEEWRDRSGELEAFNRRSAAWWHMRELLDPRFNPTLCLPPDDEMMGELAEPRLVYDQKGRIKIEDKAQTKARLRRSPDCFVAGTMVATPDGEKAIETIEAGDVVSTPFGPTRVLHRVASQSDETWVVEFGNGSRLEGKASHRVATANRGWVPLSALTPSDAVLYRSWTGRTLLKVLKPSLGRAAAGTFKHQLRAAAATTTQAISELTIPPAGLSTAAFTPSRTAPSPTDTTSTTSTTTHSTTTRTTSRPSPNPSTTATTCSNSTARQKATRHPSPDSGLEHKPQQIGTHPPRGSNGTDRTDSTLGRQRNDLSGPMRQLAKSVAILGSLTMPTLGSVLRTAANGPYRDLVDTARWPRLAVGAVACLRLTGTTRPASVPSRVVLSDASTTSGPEQSPNLPGQPAQCAGKSSSTSGEGVTSIAAGHVSTSVAVFDLVLAEHNVYWANGLLVENCGDACVYRHWIEREKPPVEEYIPPDDFGEGVTLTRPDTIAPMGGDLFIGADRGDHRM